MATTVAMLVIGLGGLWFGSVLAVDGARNAALHFRISPAFVGLTLLSIGTSVPEISVSLAGGLDRLGGLETSGIVVGSCVGSAINQLTVLLGIVAAAGSRALKVQPGRLRREGTALVVSVLVVALLGYDGELTPVDGLLMLVMYAGYLMSLFAEERVRQPATARRPALRLALDLLWLGAGLLLGGFSSGTVVDNATALAEALGWSQVFIGIFLVGLGTGLPELAISLTAVRKGESEMSVSNLLGSNICDLLFSLGVGTTVAGFAMPASVLRFDLPALMLITVAVVTLLRRGYGLSHKEGVTLVAVYFVYLVVRLAAFG